MGLIPGSGRFPGGGHGNPLQYSCLENSMNRGAQWATQSMGCKESDMTEQLALYLWKVNLQIGDWQETSSTWQSKQPQFWQSCWLSLPPWVSPTLVSMSRTNILAAIVHIKCWPMHGAKCLSLLSLGKAGTQWNFKKKSSWNMKGKQKYNKEKIRSANSVMRSWLYHTHRIAIFHS